MLNTLPFLKSKITINVSTNVVLNLTKFMLNLASMIIFSNHFNFYSIHDAKFKPRPVPSKVNRHILNFFHKIEECVIIYALFEFLIKFCENNNNNFQIKNLFKFLFKKFFSFF